MAGTYTLQPGDSPFRVAGILFGDQRWAQALSEANPGMWHPGQTIVIPDLDTSQTPVITQSWLNQAPTGYLGNTPQYRGPQPTIASPAAPARATQYAPRTNVNTTRRPAAPAPQQSVNPLPAYLPNNNPRSNNFVGAEYMGPTGRYQRNGPLPTRATQYAPRTNVNTTRRTPATQAPAPGEVNYWEGYDPRQTLFGNPAQTARAFSRFVGQTEKQIRSAITGQPAPIFLNQGQQADAARLTALAEAYQAGTVARPAPGQANPGTGWGQSVVAETLSGNLRQADLAWAARYTGLAVFDYFLNPNRPGYYLNRSILPNRISTRLAQELPYRAVAATVDDFLKGLGYEEYEPGKWQVKDPTTTIQRRGPAGPAYGYAPRLSGGYSGGFYGGGYAGGYRPPLTLWRIGL